MVDPGFILIMDDGNDVEACLQVYIFPENIGIRSPDQSLLLFPGDSLFGLHECVAAPWFHLDDDQKILIPRNDVYFIASRPPVDIKDQISLLQEVGGGDLFALFAEFVVFWHSDPAPPLPPPQIGEGTGVGLSVNPENDRKIPG